MARRPVDEDESYDESYTSRSNRPTQTRSRSAPGRQKPSVIYTDYSQKYFEDSAYGSQAGSEGSRNSSQGDYDPSSLHGIEPGNLNRLLRLGSKARTRSESDQGSAGGRSTQQHSQSGLSSEGGSRSRPLRSRQRPRFDDASSGFPGRSRSTSPGSRRSRRPRGQTDDASSRVSSPRRRPRSPPPREDRQTSPEPSHIPTSQLPTQSAQSSPARDIPPSRQRADHRDTDDRSVSAAPSTRVPADHQRIRPARPTQQTQRSDIPDPSVSTPTTAPASANRPDKPRQRSAMKGMKKKEQGSQSEMSDIDPEHFRGSDNDSQYSRQGIQMQFQPQDTQMQYQPQDTRPLSTAVRFQPEDQSGLFTDPSELPPRAKAKRSLWKPALLATGAAAAVGTGVYLYYHPEATTQVTAFVSKHAKTAMSAASTAGASVQSAVGSAYSKISTAGGSLFNGAKSGLGAMGSTVAGWKDTAFSSVAPALAKVPGGAGVSAAASTVGSAASRLTGALPDWVGPSMRTAAYSSAFKVVTDVAKPYVKPFLDSIMPPIDIPHQELPAHGAMRRGQGRDESGQYVYSGYTDEGSKWGGS